jgi:hypothetical protein
LTERVAVPEPLGIDVGKMLALSPEDGDADSVTVPENPLVGATVTTEVPVALALIGPTAVGLAVIVKFGTAEACTLNVPNIIVGWNEHS